MNNIFTYKSKKANIPRFYLLLFITFLSATISQAQTTKGAISGTIRDITGKPLEYIVIVLKKGNKSTQTDKDGAFLLKNLPEGNITLQIKGLGYTTIEQDVEVKSGETFILPDVLLRDDVNQLDEISVFSRKNKFAKKESSYIARMPIKNLENPQVYNVVSKQLMKEQVVVERSDIYRNVPGGVPTFAVGGSQGLTMRGFTNANGTLNGMNTSPVYPMNIAVLERIEFIKGPSGTLFGGGRNTSFGGVYNYVTKKPYTSFGGEASYAAGSFNFSRAAVDINTPLNKEKTALLRLNVAGQSEASFQDQGYAKNYVFAPSFSYQVTDRLKFSADIEITRSAYTATTFAIGDLTKSVTARSFKDLKLDYNRSYANNDVDVENGVNNLGAQIDYKISDQWKSETKFLSSVGYYKHLFWTTLTVTDDETVARSVRNQTPEVWGNVQLQQNFTGDFKIGSHRNRMLIGIDYNKNYYETNRVLLNYDTFKINGPVKDYNSAKINDLSYAGNGFTASTYSAENYALYFSDVIDLTPSLTAMLSLRVDRFSTKGAYSVSSGTYTPNGEYSQTSLSPKFGLVYQPFKDKLSVFANYMNGFVNLAPAQNINPDKTTTIVELDPQYGTQWETGIKYDIIENKLSGSISYYDIKVTNSTYKDAANNTVQDGTQNSKGFEVEIIANPFPGLNIVAGYANNENKYTKASVALQGKTLTASPENVVNIWASYRITEGKSKGLGLGIGGNYVDESWFETTNVFAIPAYTLLNAALFYDQPKYTIALKGNNLLDEKYWNALGMPQKPLNILASITFKF